MYCLIPFNMDFTWVLHLLALFAFLIFHRFVTNYCKLFLKINHVMFVYRYGGLGTTCSHNSSSHTDWLAAGPELWPQSTVYCCVLVTT
jgi:hypothetical protein